VIAGESGIAEQLDRLFDVCIIGSGAAGITLAVELDGSRLTVALLEAGELELSESSQQYYKGQEDTVKMPPQYLTAMRLRAFGGTTGHWQGEGRPLDEIDFETREWIPHSGWPLRRAELEEFYTRAARYCSFQAIPAAGFSAESQTQSGRAGCFDFKPLYRAALPPRFGKLHRAALAASTNVTLFLSCPVVDIQSDPVVSARVDSVVVAPARGGRRRLRARQFILAAGTVENARLALSSMSSGALRADGADVVGRYFMDHGEGLVGVFSAAEAASAPISRLIAEAKPFRVQGFVSAIGISAQAQREGRLPNVGFEIAKIQGDDNQEDKTALELAEVDRLRTVLSGAPPGAPAYFRVTFRSETRPDPDNRVTLTEEKDPLGVPRIKLHYRWSEDDMRGADTALRLLAQDWSGPHGVLVRQLERADRRVTSSFHQMGTTRMGDNPRSSWVDGRCKVHSARNLFVAGSSVFPTVGWANPTLTIVALAIRLADHLKQNSDAHAA